MEMEGIKNQDFCFSSSESEEYSKELDVAIRAIHLACSLCQKFQDNSDIVIADCSILAIVSWVLTESFGSENVSIVTKDVQNLSNPDSAVLLEAVVKAVNESISDAHSFGLDVSSTAPLSSSDVLEAITGRNTNKGQTGRFWTLNSDTLDFVQQNQCAIALALIVDGEVVLGVIGCPNHPMKKELLSYHHRYHRNVTFKSWDKGCVLYAMKGTGEAMMMPLHKRNNNLIVSRSNALRIQASSTSIDNPVVESGVGLRIQYSVAKYAAIARGDAELSMEFAKAGCKEKIWDHAAGVVIIQEAGGVVSDVGGSPLDFSKGIYLEGLDRGIIVSSGAKLQEEIIDAVDASWYSSCL